MSRSVHMRTRSLLSLTALTGLLALSACATAVDAPTTGDDASAADEAMAGHGESADHGEMDEGEAAIGSEEEQEETADDDASMSGGMGQGMEGHHGMTADADDAATDEGGHAEARSMAEEMVREMMLGMAVEQGWLEQADMATYVAADEVLSAYRPEGAGALGQGLPREERMAMQEAAARAAVADGALEQAQADLFLLTFGRLLEEGLVP